MQGGAQCPVLAFAPPGGHALRFTYKNWRGEVAERHIEAKIFWFGATEYHPEAQCLLRGVDLDREGHPERDFAVRDMTNVRFATAA